MRNLKAKFAVAALSVAFTAIGTSYLLEDTKKSKKNLEETIQQVKDYRILQEDENTPKIKKEFEVYHWKIKNSNYTLPYFICRGNYLILEGLDKLGKNARKLNEIKDHKGNHFFTCKDITKYLRYGGTVDYAQELASLVDVNGNNLFYGAQLPQLSILGLTAAELINFTDTEKQNALVIYSTYDRDDENREGAFKTLEALSFFSKIKASSDLKVAVISTKEEFCDVIDDKLNFERVMIGGHGTKEYLQLGEGCNLFKKECDGEKYQLNLGDYELGTCLDKLNKNAIIFLNSCSTAEGGKEAFNFANFFAYLANDRKIIASKVPFSSEDMVINSDDPFDLRIVKEGIDYTYVTQGLEGIEKWGLGITITPQKH